MSETKDTGTELVPVTGRVVTTQQIEDAGLLMPLADPAALRAAFAERQRVLTSILDPDRDFLYTVRYLDAQGNQRQVMCQTLDEAKKQVTHLGGGSSWSAHPKKSGVLKLAHALGIESRQVEVTGLPKDPRATYSSCRYIATHRRTGRSEEGQGYCDASERGGKQKAHAIISMADTRAYCHAVLRCAGYDNVGAEEMDLDDSAGVVTIQNVMPAERNRPALSSQTSPRAISIELAAAPATEKVSIPVSIQLNAAPASAPTPEPLPPLPPPEGLGKGDVITNAMAAELSQKLLAKLGSKDKARAWLKENAGVERSVHVREDQIGSLDKALDALEAP
jgi:hypothetical protein